MPITPRSGVNAAQMAANWSKGVAANAQKYVQGATNPRRMFNADPSGSQAAWQTGINDAIGRNAYAQGVANTDTNAMATNITNLGGPRYAQSGTQKAQKFTAKTAALAAANQSVQQSIANMPRGGIANNTARMVAWAQGMAAFKGKI